MGTVPFYVKAESKSAYIGWIDGGSYTESFSTGDVLGGDNFKTHGSILITPNGFPSCAIINSVGLHYSAYSKPYSSSTHALRLQATYVESYSIHSDKTYSYSNAHGKTDLIIGKKIAGSNNQSEIIDLGSWTASELLSGVRINLGMNEYNSFASKFTVSDIYLIIDYTIPSYYLDLNGMLDGVSSGGISPYGTADVYINGALVSSGCGDFWQSYEYGTTYEIKNIKANNGYQYDGIYSGSLSGTITATTSVVLRFSTVATPPEFTSASLTYAGSQVSQTNKVPAGESCILSVGVT